MFGAQSFWRDLIAFSWNIITVEGPEGVRDLLRAHPGEHAKPTGWHTTEEPAEAGGVTEAWIEFETAVGRGKGHLRLRGRRRAKAWTLLTTLYELKGHEEPHGRRPAEGAEHGANRDRRDLAGAARARGGRARLRDPAVRADRRRRPGRHRARRPAAPARRADDRRRQARRGPATSGAAATSSLCLHDPVWYDHLPYIKFPENWPVFAPKDKIADWLESYTQVMELNYWSQHRGQERARTTRRPASGRSTVEREGQPIVLRPKQLVLATGMSGKPNIPEFPGMDVFRGDQHHSSAHPGPDAYEGKKCVVVGSNNSAFDICGALWEEGADVTMVQRSSTHIVRSDTLMDIGLGALYSEEAVAGRGDHGEGRPDLRLAAVPDHARVPDPAVRRRCGSATRTSTTGWRRPASSYDWGQDGSGLFMKYLRRGSGYYIDVGAADLVANGDVKLVKGQVDHLTEDAVVLEDGTELPADLVVYATGYGSMNGWVADLISPEVGRQGRQGLGPRLGHAPRTPGPWEGEQRNMWKPTRQPALWFHGGNLHQSRHYSLYLALQLKARYEGIPTPVYGLAPVHHTR